MAYTTLVAGTTITAAWANASVRDQSVSTFASSAARSSAVTSPVEGMVSHLADVNTLGVYSGAAWSTIGPVHGACTSWTPTVTQSGSVTVTVTAASYSRLGRLIIGACILTVTGSGTGANDVVISLPVNAAAGLVVNGILGAGFIYDSSATQKHRGHVVVGATAGVARMLSSSSGADAYMGSNSFTAGLAVNDVISMQFMYEAAADA